MYLIYDYRFKTNWDSVIITYHSAVKSTTTNLLSAASSSGKRNIVGEKKFWQRRKVQIIFTCSKLRVIRDNFDGGHDGGFHLWNTHLRATKSTSSFTTEQRKPIWNDFNFSLKMIWQLPRRSLCAETARMPRPLLSQGGLEFQQDIKQTLRRTLLPG